MESNRERVSAGVLVPGIIREFQLTLAHRNGLELFIFTVRASSGSYGNTLLMILDCQSSVIEAGHFLGGKQGSKP